MQVKKTTRLTPSGLGGCRCDHRVDRRAAVTNALVLRAEAIAVPLAARPDKPLAPLNGAVVVPADVVPAARAGVRIQSAHLRINDDRKHGF